VRSNSFHRQNVQRLAELVCKRELYACLCSSRSSKLDYVDDDDDDDDDDDEPHECGWHKRGAHSC
jgi:hypothetical protein